MGKHGNLSGCLMLYHDALNSVYNNIMAILCDSEIDIFNAFGKKGHIFSDTTLVTYLGVLLNGSTCCLLAGLKQVQI